MNTKNRTPQNLFVLILILLFASSTSHAQFLKKLSQKAGEAAERAVTRKTEEKVDHETSKAMDSILNPGSNAPDELPNQKTNTNKKETSSDESSENNATNDSSSKESKTLQVYRKFDFVPGDKLVFFDDFSNDFIGDFPSKWNTNGTGEVITFDDTSGKWFEIKDGSNSFYIANITTLPEEYTIEFDMETIGLNQNTSSASSLAIIIDKDDDFGWGENSVYTYIPFCQYTAVGIRIWNRINGETTINNIVEADLREEIKQRPHVSIAVNKQRYRLFINEIKYVDVPRMIGTGAPLKSLKFQLSGTVDGVERIFIKNIKIAEGGLDLRRTLISEGRVSTNGILFDAGSSDIQPQSMGIILQISQVLQQEKTMKLKIIGHTDTDGDNDSNLKLSQQRAHAVKNALTTIYGISEERLVAEGKGEANPVSDNSTSDGKAQNRRVEFIKF